ncbi:MAG TPA: NADP-dependent phosphogluconate dehydrogenase [Opitutaceae bacterium]|jgi:6-phosphogluconate dehydrogenase
MARFEVGMVGLGVMGRNFLLNMADRGYPVAGYDKDPGKVASLSQEAGSRDVYGDVDLGKFVGALRRPRAVMLLVPAGPPVDSVIRDLSQHLQAGDLIIDGGNSNFRDTDRRASELQASGIHFLGVGVSGGEKGARNGPSIMPGGPQEAYKRIQPVFEAAAAKVNSEPCVTYLGPGSAGHFVKMVHNGIEYGLMQLIAETYDLMKRGVGLNDDELHEFFAGWNHGEMGGYLMEITGQIFSEKDAATGLRLVDEIKGVAAQLGTGMWTSQSALELDVPIPTIDVAVGMRNLSVLEGDRKAAQAALPRPTAAFAGDRDAFLKRLGRGLFAGTIIAYAQGLAVLKAASAKYGYGYDMSAIARIWRGGCIIRSDLLEHIKRAYLDSPALPNLLIDPEIAKMLVAHEEDLRAVVIEAARLGIPAPGLMSALGYLDALRSAWLPANLIQAQRDYFGAHRYERTDKPGSFHTEWESAGDE